MEDDTKILEVIESVRASLPDVEIPEQEIVPRSMGEEIYTSRMPMHGPTKETRKIVESMSAYGIPQTEIAKVIGISPSTLQEHYRTELDTATAKANAAVAGKLYGKCMSGDVTSMIFWLKTRGRWSERLVVENTGSFEHNLKFNDPAEAAAAYKRLIKPDS